MTERIHILWRCKCHFSLENISSMIWFSDLFFCWSSAYTPLQWGKESCPSNRFPYPEWIANNKVFPTISVLQICYIPVPCVAPRAVVWKRSRLQDGREPGFFQGRWTSRSLHSWLCWPEQIFVVKDGESDLLMRISRLTEKITSPKILCATGSPRLRMLLSSISSSNKLINRLVRKLLMI